MYVAFKGTMLGAAQTDFVLAQIMREFSDGTVSLLYCRFCLFCQTSFFFFLQRFVLFADRCRTGTIWSRKRRILFVVGWKQEAGCLKR
jgi:hypothetical protein